MLSRRLAFLLNYAGIAGVVLGLSKVHATWLAEPGYDFTRSFRLPWAVVFVAYLSVAAYTVGLPDMPRRLMQRVAAACAAVGAAIVGVWASQFVVGSALMPRSVILGSAAALVPWFTFTSVIAAGLADPPPNLILAGFVSDDELRELLWSSGVYAQLSWHEGFGVSMVEAMQAGCQPVVTDVPALTEIAGPDAIQSPHQGHDVGAIARAAASPADRSALARWATTVASMDERAAGLESALFAGN
jgi:glycosyltransferase involved in cell wall biosynthesis